MHVAVTGSRGLVGGALLPLLTTVGHQVTTLVRGTASEGQVAWDPVAGSFDASVLNGVDGVMHLAGENIAAARWTATQKQRIRESRIHGTRS